MLAFPWMPWYSWNIAKVGVKHQSIIPVTQFQPVWPFANSYKMRSTYIAAGNSHHTLDQFDGIRKLLISACVYKNEISAVWRFKIWFNPPFLLKYLYQVRVITVFTVFRMLTDFVCLYTYEFLFSHCKIVRSSVILLLPLFSEYR